MKIMIVDDELVSRKKLSMILSPKGEIYEFERGKPAIEAFEEAYLENAPYSLITLDISMPEMDGVEVLTVLRDIEEKYRKIEDKPIIMVMVTGEKDLSTIHGAINHKCDDYISKPFNKEFINSRFEEWFSE